MSMLQISAAWEPLLHAWDTDLRAAGRPRTTRYQRCYHVRRFAHTHPGPQRVTRADLVSWFADYEWAPETRRSYRSSISLFFRWAVDAGYLTINPAVNLPTVRLPRSRPRPAPTSAINTALAGADERVRLMIYILALTGLRRGEVARVRAEDVEETLDGWRLRVTGKGGHVRFVPLDNDLAWRIRGAGPGYVFPGQIDGHLSAAYVGKLVSWALPEGWTAHTLRHRFATLTYRDSRDIRAVQELLGHASVRTTQVYTDVPDSALRVAARAARSGLSAA